MFLEEISKEIIWRKNPEKIHQKTVPGIRFTCNTKRCFLKDNSHIHLLAAKNVLKSAQKLFLKKLCFFSCTCHLESVSALTKTPGLLSEATYLLQIAHHQNRHLVHFYKSLFWWWAIRRIQICSENNPGVFDDSETDSKVISLPQVYMRQTITSLGIASVHFPRRFLSPLKVRFGAFLPLINRWMWLLS